MFRKKNSPSTKRARSSSALCEWGSDTGEWQLQLLPRRIILATRAICSTSNHLTAPLQRNQLIILKAGTILHHAFLKHGNGLTSMYGKRQLQKAESASPAACEKRD